MKPAEQVAMWAGLGLVVFIAVVYLAKKAGQGVAAAAQAINPVSNKNVVYQGVTAVEEAITGDTSKSLGGFFWDMTHSAKVKEIQAMQGPIIPTTAQTDAAAAPAPSSGSWWDGVSNWAKNFAAAEVQQPSSSSVNAGSLIH